VPQPFELARTLLVKGEVERRAKQKRAARSTLEEALGLFLALGAPLWARRARDDLARVGGAMLPSSELTPTEQRIAQLVGEGKKNREVAEALFISVKTVEANLHGSSTSSGFARAQSSPARSPPMARGFPPIPHGSTGPSLLANADPDRPERVGTRHGTDGSNRTTLRAGLASHCHRGCPGIRHGGRRGRHGRAHHGVRAGRQ
jgi:DNA-binding CsgD family transcriptional regulator